MNVNKNYDQRVKDFRYQINDLRSKMNDLESIFMMDDASIEFISILDDEVIKSCKEFDEYLDSLQPRQNTEDTLWII